MSSSLSNAWASFEERNVILQALLGIVAATENWALICTGEPHGDSASSPAPNTPEPPGPLHSALLFTLGIISVRDALQRELLAEGVRGAGALPGVDSACERPKALQLHTSMSDSRLSIDLLR
jgi:hypothetical protein